MGWLFVKLKGGSLKDVLVVFRSKVNRLAAILKMAEIGNIKRDKSKINDISTPNSLILFVIDLLQC